MKGTAKNERGNIEDKSQTLLKFQAAGRKKTSKKKNNVKNRNMFKKKKRILKTTFKLY